MTFIYIYIICFILYTTFTYILHIICFILIKLQMASAPFFIACFSVQVLEIRISNYSL